MRSSCCRRCAGMGAGDDRRSLGRRRIRGLLEQPSRRSRSAPMRSSPRTSPSPCRSSFTSSRTSRWCGTSSNGRSRSRAGRRLGVSRRTGQSAHPSDDHAAATDRGRVWAEEGAGPWRGRPAAAQRCRQDRLSRCGPESRRRLHCAIARAGSLCQNKHLALAGLDIRVDGRSFAKHGIDLQPTIHLGVAPRRSTGKSATAGWSPKLERIALFEDGAARERARASCAVRRSCSTSSPARRASSTNATSPRSCIAMSTMPALFQRLMARILQSPDVLRLEPSASTLRPASGRRQNTRRAR